MRLSAQTLGVLGPDVDAPDYDRARVRVGIVHFGVGGFHRSHQARYVDRLLRLGEGFDFGICGVGVLPGDTRVRDVLREQDGLYTLVERAADGTESAAVVGSIVRYLHLPDEPAAVVDVLADPHTRIVSLTVTEGGYCLDPHTGTFDPDHPAVQADLADDGPPQTPFAPIVEALARRRARDVAPFTVLSCDNVPGNGQIIRGSVVGFAALRDADLAQWIDAHTAFPDSMVDRITPATTDADRDAFASRFGWQDGWPVFCEPFSQWVIEDDFPLGRPAFERVGAQLVTDPEPYETLKLRLLNGGHQALGYLGTLLGHDFVDIAARDPRLQTFFTAYTDEVRPTLPDVEDVDVPAYRDELLERFGNPAIRDSLARICAYSSDRMPKFVLPAIHDNLAAGRDVSAAALVVAAWARYCETATELVDPRADELRAAARRRTEDPLAFLRDRALFGDLVDQSTFTRGYAAALDSLVGRGPAATLDGFSR